MRPTQLAPHDSAVWHTIDIAMHLDAGVVQRRAAVDTTFPLSPGDRALAEGSYVLHTLASPGDGSYRHDSGFFFATGKGGLAVTGAIALGRAWGNSRRRRQAQEAAAPRWMPMDQGHVVVSLRSFYLQTADGRLLPWSWDSLDSVSLVSAGRVHLAGRGISGAVSWVLESDWAELVFVLWCRDRHPTHPQYLSNAWLPEGWLGRVQVAGFAPPLRPTTALGGVS